MDALQGGHPIRHRILIVGKEPNMCEEIKQSLHLHDIDADVDCVSTCTQALSYISRYQYTLIIMGLLFAEDEGVAVIQKLRKLEAAPILVLSARATVREEVELLNAGADRYIGMKDALDLEQCLANAKAIMRRHTSPAAKEFSYILISGSGLKIDLRMRRAYARGDDLRLTPKQFALLHSLVEHMGEVVSKEQLYDDAWALEADINADDALKYHIKELRKKLREHGLGDPIGTIWGVGYLFCAEDVSDDS